MNMNYNISILLNIIIFVIGITILFTLSCSILTLINQLAEKALATDIYKYYIYNIYFSTICILFYISFFIVFLYSLRIYNVNHTIDLKNLLIIKTLLQPLPLIVVIYTILFSMLIMINFLLIIICIYKYLIHQVFIVYIYIRYNKKRPLNDRLTKWILDSSYDSDIISYHICELSRKITQYLNNDYKYNQLPWYHFHKVIAKITYSKHYKSFIVFSPFVIILYDCIFNNLIITHVFYYLLLYIPIMLWKRIIISLHDESTYICELLWNIYYKKEICIYAVLPNQKKLLELYLVTGLKSCLELGLDPGPEIYLRDVIKFTPDNDNPDIYCNSECICLQKISDNRLLSDELLAEDGESWIRKEWIVLVDKSGSINKNIP